MIAVPIVMLDETHDEMQHLSGLRAKALYNGYKNSIVEWTLSEQWTNVPKITDTEHKRGRIDLQFGNGSVWVNTCEGEITCTTL